MWINNEGPLDTKLDAANAGFAGHLGWFPEYVWGACV
jgi:hypothetical protein